MDFAPLHLHWSMARVPSSTKVEFEDLVAPTAEEAKAMERERGVARKTAARKAPAKKAAARKA